MKLMIPRSLALLLTPLIKRNQKNKETTIYRWTLLQPRCYLTAICLYTSLSSVFGLELPDVEKNKKEYVGSQTCQACHLTEYQQWHGSQHDLAMQVANDQSVLGNFNNITFVKGDITTTFYKKNNRFMVNTDGENGKLENFEIAYTFGVYPLQQYMVQFSKGRIQVLDIAWDSRTREEGGQRWFSLHPDETIPAGDVLHWTGPNLNWNYMCADCHSTNLKKNYNPVDNSYSSQWDAINVSCEACHGPASKHVQLATEKKNWDQTKGLSFRFSSAKKRHWQINQATGKPMLLVKESSSEELVDKAFSEKQDKDIEVCARCHSRRTQLDDHFVPGDNFRDHYLPALLTDSLYYHDGKIKDEVYVYGSFLQSKMYQSGVICSDCHNMHSLNLKLPGDTVCQQCHNSSDYATPKHHFHEEQSKDVTCIACHMPPKTYMGVDVRYDHSFRIPRPDLSQALEIPDACTNCHQDKNSQWAADAIYKWYGRTPEGHQQFAQALYNIDQQNEQAFTGIYDALLNDTPDIAKATIISHLGDYPSRQTLMTAVQMLKSKGADIRRAALESLEAFPVQQTLRSIFPLLNDPVKSVRLQAAQMISSIPKGELSKEQEALLKQSVEEYRQTLLFASDRPETQLSLAQLYQNEGKPDKAEKAFNKALELQEQFVPAYINYATFLQQQGRETDAYNILEKGITINNDAVLYYSLGLWYVRQKERDKGLKYLQTAAEMEIDNAQYQYVYAVAVADKDIKKAIVILESSLQKHSGHLDTLMALASYYKQVGDRFNADKYLRKIDSLMTYKIN